MRKNIIKLILLFSGFVLSVAINAQSTNDRDKDKEAMDVFLDAEKNKMLTNYPEAIKLYKETLDIDAEYDPAMFQMARLYIFEQKFDEALFWAEKAYQLDKQNTWYALLLIDLYRNSYQIGEAIIVYNELLEEEPTNTEYLLSVSGMYLSIEDNDNALKCLNRIEELEGVSEKTSFQ
ncbi:MAG: tetratricopeptide repeat protein, partial [Bacteroidales bacterium]|nr:tetratricopeptide repeat protein [Bacteroidales bacterium]